MPDLKPCAECGMPCTRGEYHPYAACLMFKACQNTGTVRENLRFVREYDHPPEPSNREQLAMEEAVILLDRIELMEESFPFSIDLFLPGPEYENWKQAVLINRRKRHAILNESEVDE